MQYKTKILDPNFRKSFLKELQTSVKQNEEKSGNANCIETILELCEKYDVEPESINPIINRAIKAKIREEAIEKNLMKGKKKKKLI